MIQLSRSGLIFGLIGAMICFSGCGSPETPQTKPEIVQKKIAAKPKLTGSAGSANLLSPDLIAQKMKQDNNQPAPVPTVPDVHASIPETKSDYNPEGKIDPFIPLLQEEADKPLVPEKPKKEKRQPATPLERVDISQLKLTAIMKTPSGYKAMVEEQTGTGYIVEIGTFMGIHEGKVTEILKDRLIVEEEIEDASGNDTVRNTELKFQRPAGEF